MGNYVKDLNKLGRDLQKIVIVDNSPASYIFHPDNAVSRKCSYTPYSYLMCVPASYICQVTISHLPDKRGP
jgi:hypothetical protein